MARGRTDFEVSLSQLKAQLPNLKRVSLVVGWFGDDLRAGHCSVRPGVESRDKATEPMEWSVAGITREGAHLVSRIDGRPAYGGTPSDESVRQAIAMLKAEGLEVTLYPFVFMDIPANNPLGQAPYPWRGRIRGEDGPSAAADTEALFHGEWGLRRMALHYAAIAAKSGADGLLIGSEMRGVTWTRDAAGEHPAVSQLKDLAAACRAVVGDKVSLSYAADWSEYFGHHAGNDVIFHLDPLWADPAIDHVAIDWYPPLTDWRDGDGGLDGAAFKSASDPLYLAAGVAGGDGFDWFYASEADRAAQVRTPIIDTAHGEHWVFRPKDLAGWWSHAHHDRPGGVRSQTPTAWAPGMKPVRLSEFGCAAVDRGGNAPNLFQDPKSAESALPPYSTGARDDAVQRAALTAVLDHYRAAENNPVSTVYGGRMLEAADAWCWDARPFPAFPALAEVWGDAGGWAAGHWLNGRLTCEAATLVEAVLARGGVEAHERMVRGLSGAAAGYVIDRPMRTRDALEPLLTAFNAVATEQDGRAAVLGAPDGAMRLDADGLAAPEGRAALTAERTLEARPAAARVRFIDEAADYQTGAVVARADDPAAAGGRDLDLPLACGVGLAKGAAERALGAQGGETITAALGPLQRLMLEAGDAVTLEGRPGSWRVMRIADDETPTAALAAIVTHEGAPDHGGWKLGEAPTVVGKPFLRLLDLPPLMGAEEDARPLVVLAGEPWRPMRLHAGPTVEALTARATAETPAAIGMLMRAVEPGVRHRWDEAKAFLVRVEGRSPVSARREAVLAGANALALETANGWEIVQFRTASLVGEGLWRLSGLLRGQQGSDAAMRAGAAAGAVVVFLDAEAPRADIGRNECGLSLICRAGPAGAPPGGAGFTELSFRFDGLHHRPWSPAGLRLQHEVSGVRVRWTARVRRYGDAWDAEPAATDPARFRVRVLDGALTLRVVELQGGEMLYGAAEMAADFPSGVAHTARIAVSQWGEAFGWGAEAEIALR